jgi:hypothetical protein
MNKLLDFLDKLEQYNLSYTLDRLRDDAILVRIQPGPCEYWEVEFFCDGHTEVQSTDLKEIWYNEEADQILIDKLFSRKI